MIIVPASQLSHAEMFMLGNNVLGAVVRDRRRPCSSTVAEKPSRKARRRRSRAATERHKAAVAQVAHA